MDTPEKDILKSAGVQFASDNPDGFMAEPTEVVAETQEAVVQEPEVVVEESSLNNEITPEPVVENTGTVQETNEIKEESETFGEFVSIDEPNTETPNDAQAFDLISEFNSRFNTEFTSEEDIQGLMKKEEMTEAGNSLNRFLKANEGKTPYDWFQAVAVDVNQIPAKDLIIQEYMSKGMSQEDASFTYNQKFAQTEIEEDYMSEDDLKSAQSQNRVREIEANQIANELREKRLKIRQDYQTSMDAYTPPTSEEQNVEMFSQEDRDNWRQQTDESLRSLETMTIPLDDGLAFKISNKDFFASQKDSISDPEKAWDFLQTAEGGWDVAKLNRLRAIDHNFDKISKALFNHGRGTGQEETINRGKNLNYNKPKEANTGSSADAAQAEMEAVLRRNLGHQGLSL